MFTIFLEHKLLSGIMFFFLLLSIICQMVVGVIYRRLIRETENMSSTDNKTLKQCKLKFTNCFQLNGGVSNIPVFVDKFISRVTVMRITLRGLQHLSGQMMLLSVLTAGIGACLAIIRGETIGRLLPYYIVSFLGLYAYFAVSGMVDIQGKRDKLKVHLIDYLENHMVNKLRQTALDQILITPEPEPEFSTQQKKTKWKTNRSIPESEQWQTASLNQDHPEIDYIPVKNTDSNINKINTPEPPQDSTTKEMQTTTPETPQATRQEAPQAATQKNLKKESKKPKISALLKKQKETPATTPTPETTITMPSPATAMDKSPLATTTDKSLSTTTMDKPASPPALDKPTSAPALDKQASITAAGKLPQTAAITTPAQTPAQTSTQSPKHQEPSIQESEPFKESTLPKATTAEQARKDKKIIFSQQEKKELEELLQEFLVL